MVSSLYKRIKLSIFEQNAKTYTVEEITRKVEDFYGGFEEEKKSLTIPLENEWLEVDPLMLIEQECFQQERSNWSEEKTRKEILEAFEEARKNPERYLKKFKTIIPVKTWDRETTEKECIQIANEYKGQVADWVEQRLQWAQCIINNEFIGWRTVCNRIDTSNHYRIIKDKDGQLKQVGGSRNQFYSYNMIEANNLSTTINEYNIRSYDSWFAVPLIVSYNSDIDEAVSIKKEQNSTVVLKIRGKEMLFSCKELEAIFEICSQITAAVPMPIENEWFEVNPNLIDMNQIKEAYHEVYERTDRVLLQHLVGEINYAIEVAERNPTKYCKKYKIMFPTKTWREPTTKEKLEELSRELGDHLADNVEVFIQIAYSIIQNENRAFWPDQLFYNRDNSNWHRVAKKNTGEDYCAIGDSILSRRIYNEIINRGYAPMKQDIIRLRDSYVPFIVSYDD